MKNTCSSQLLNSSYLVTADTTYKRNVNLLHLPSMNIALKVEEVKKVLNNPKKTTIHYLERGWIAYHYSGLFGIKRYNNGDLKIGCKHIQKSEINKLKKYLKITTPVVKKVEKVSLPKSLNNSHLANMRFENKKLDGKNVNTIYFPIRDSHVLLNDVKEAIINNKKRTIYMYKGNKNGTLIKGIYWSIRRKNRNVSAVGCQNIDQNSLDKLKKYFKIK